VASIYKTKPNALCISSSIVYGNSLLILGAYSPVSQKTFLNSEKYSEQKIWHMPTFAENRLFVSCVKNIVIYLLKSFFSSKFYLVYTPQNISVFS
jgi:hypothetical protein